MAQGQGRSSGQGVKLLYIRDYLYAYATKEHPKNAKHIVEYLASHGIDASVKTIYNDILRLQIDFGVPVEYNPQKWGYYITQPQFEPYELRQIVNSIQAAKFITQNEADRLTRKIMVLSDVYTRQSLNRKILVQNRARSINKEVMRNLDTIYEAIDKDKKISYKYFHYTSNREFPKKYISIDNSKIITVSPYRVMWYNEKFLVFSVGQQDGKRCLYSLDLNYMEQIKILEDSREDKDFFELYINHAKKRKDPIPTKLKFSTSNMDEVYDKFGADIMIVPSTENDYRIAILDVLPTPELFLWTQQCRPPIEMIYPKWATEAFRRYFREISNGNTPLTIRGLLESKGE